MRAIRRGPKYQRQLEEIFGSESRAEAAVRGLEWHIQRRPEMGHAVPGLDPKRFASWVSHSPGPSIHVVYEFNDREVICISARTVISSNRDFMGR